MRKQVRSRALSKVCGLIFVLASHPVFAENPTFSVKLELIEGTALFALTMENSSVRFQPEANYFRLWGVEILRPLPESILQQVFDCEEVGFVYARDVGRGRIVQCRNEELDLSEFAIRNGYAIELCSETNNLYQTCRFPVNMPKR